MKCPLRKMTTTTTINEAHKAKTISREEFEDCIEEKCQLFKYDTAHDDYYCMLGREKKYD